MNLRKSRSPKRTRLAFGGVGGVTPQMVTESANVEDRGGAPGRERFAVSVPRPTNAKGLYSPDHLKAAAAKAKAAASGKLRRGKAF